MASGIVCVAMDDLQAAGWRKDQITDQWKLLSIVRLSEGSYACGSGCFFPGKGLASDDVLPRVDARVYSSGKDRGQRQMAKRFLIDVGVRGRGGGTD